MELASIEKLVEKYLNAETSVQEETSLRDYFLSDNVAPHLEEYKLMFSYFQLNKDETYTKTIQLKPENTKRKNLKWLSVAASVALLVSVYVGKVEYDKYVIKQKYAQVENALKMLSTNLNKGKSAFNNLYAYENTVNKIFKAK
ncbi:hypothetical protein RQM59_05520 [Flavobacteriaceae bacterium S356]|uniref:Uncharacterized protein n=1 Tax=Asprobacillus argus TaxID=3076534 RepID=A0ABU3LDN4_9FLAO|nr:hypothetical protein [Flavobacteriaceae bacterium S356]